MARWKLTDKQWDALDELRFSTTDVAVFRNALIILMTGAGRSKDSIAKELGCCRATVDNMRKRYRESGVQGLVPHKSTGRTSRATTQYRAALRSLVQTPPQTLGYGFSVWSVARINEHLKKQTDIGFSEDRLRAILREEGFSFQRPKHTMKGKRDEAAYERARRQLKRLKKGRCEKPALLP
jgi:transposase